MSSVTLGITKELEEKIVSSYSSFLKEPPTPYIAFFIKGDGFNISIYKRKEGEPLSKALFQGEKAEEIAKHFGYIEVNKEVLKKHYSFPLNGQIGSDEVGTGDFFGPVCVVAAFIVKDDLARLKELGVTDSKLLSDEAILKIGPTLVKEFAYSSLTLDNKRYNEITAEGLNMNAIKAKMHNAALLNLKRKFPKAIATIDQFATPKTYYSYLKDEKEVLTDIIFSVKGEKAFPSVALASCIARYSFLKHMDILNKQIGMDIPLGAGSIVDSFAKKLLKEKGISIFNQIAKTNFKNFEKLF